MKRYVFCPSESYLDDATSLAKEVSLPILVGDNDDTLNMVFDRTSVSVIKIPEHRFVEAYSEKVELGFHQTIRYVNEFKKLKNNVKMYVNGDIIPPLYEEMHVVKFNFLCSKIGEYLCIIMISGEKEEEFSFVVD